jgi:hypothetical protein
MNFTYNGRTYAASATVPAGQSRVVKPPLGGLATLAVYAIGAGVSALIEVSNSPDGGGELRWTPALGLGDAGTLSNASVVDVIPSSISAVRVTAAGGDVIVEVQQ